MNKENKSDNKSESLGEQKSIILEEPFRIFFPLGLLAAVAGLLIWPVFYAGWMKTYPALIHPRLMIFGFGGAFLTGFLGTAWPRFVESRSLDSKEVAALVSCWAAAQFFWVLGAIQPGDLAFAIQQLLLILFLGRLAGLGKDGPPPGFILAFGAPFIAAGVLLRWCFGEMETMTPADFVVMKLMAYQGYLLFPLLGVGTILFPRVFYGGKPQSQTSPKRKMIGIFGAAIVVIASFCIEAFGMTRSGNLLRFAAMIAWAWLAFPEAIPFRGKCPSTRAWALRMTLGAVALCFLIRGIWPGPGFAVEHLLFIGGFGVAMLLISDRVVLGHCAESPKTAPISKSWRWIIWLMWLTFATRATADIVPSTQMTHHIYAAVAFVVIIGIWIGIHRKHFHKIAPD